MFRKNAGPFRRAVTGSAATSPGLPWPGDGSVDHGGRVVTGVWQGWDREEAAAWCEAFFPHRFVYVPGHFESSQKTRELRLARRAYVEHGTLPPFPGWPANAVMFRALGMTPADYLAWQSEEGRRGWFPDDGRAGKG